MEIYRWSWLYFLSFIFFNAFVFLNMMIGIVIEKMQQESNGDNDISQRLARIEEKLDQLPR
jgi:voltage-gated sodium channel